MVTQFDRRNNSDRMGYISSVAFSPDGTSIVFGDIDGAMFLRDAPFVASL
jgi:hypothetical protein